MSGEAYPNPNRFAIARGGPEPGRAGSAQYSLIPGGRPRAGLHLRLRDHSQFVDEEIHNSGASVRSHSNSLSRMCMSWPMTGVDAVVVAHARVRSAPKTHRAGKTVRTAAPRRLCNRHVPDPGLSARELKTNFHLVHISTGSQLTVAGRNWARRAARTAAWSRRFRPELVSIFVSRTRPSVSTSSNRVTGPLGGGRTPIRGSSAGTMYVGTGSSLSVGDSGSQGGSSMTNGGTAGDAAAAHPASGITVTNSPAASPARTRFPGPPVNAVPLS